MAMLISLRLQLSLPLPSIIKGLGSNWLKPIVCNLITTAYVNSIAGRLISSAKCVFIYGSFGQQFGAGRWLNGYKLARRSAGRGFEFEARNLHKVDSDFHKLGNDDKISSGTDGSLSGCKTVNLISSVTTIPCNLTAHLSISILCSRSAHQTSFEIEVVLWWI